MVFEAAELLRQRGVHTAQRLAVLRAVSARPHIAAHSVAEAVRAKIGTISRQTVDDASSFDIDEAEVIYWGQCPQCLGSTPVSAAD